MDALELLERRIRKHKFLYPTDFYITGGSLGLTKKEINKMIRRLERKGKLKANKRYFELDFDF